MKKVGERIRWLREEIEWTQLELSKKIGINNSVLSRIETGKRPVEDILLDIFAETFSVTADYLLGRTDNRRESLMIHEKTDSPPANIKMLPVLGIIRAGDPLFADDNIIGYEPANADGVKNGDFFYLKVTGDSMTGSRIQDGDMVLVQKQSYVEDGQVAVVIVNSNEATLKRIYKQNDGLLLQADNPKYPPAFYKAQDVQIIGKVVKVEFRLDP